MPNSRSTFAPALVFNYGIGIFGRAIECYQIGDEFFLYGVTVSGDSRILLSIGMTREVAASAMW